MDVGPFESMTAQAFAERVPQTVEFAEMVQPTGVLKFSGPMRSVQLTVSTGEALRIANKSCFRMPALPKP